MKYKVGEICECKGDKEPLNNCWVECEIVHIGNPREQYNGSHHPADYTIDIPGTPAPSGQPYWLAAEVSLRKKRAPKNGLKITKWRECPWVPDEIFSSWPDKLDI